MELKIEYVGLDEIRPYEKNARAHKDLDVDAIAKSITEFGFNDPIGVWNDVIVEGHGRLEAAKKLKMEKVPIIRLDHMTDEERKAYALAHNKTAELSSWDEEALAAALSDISEIDMSAFGFDMSVFEEEKEIVDPVIPEPPEEPKSKKGDVWILGAHRVMCGDSTNPEDMRVLMGG